ncbi:uncharacterized protein [Cicer arietinum]|uniref:Trihelix transcription factor ASIL1 isoform X2 n=1 Tax=Cicer arietinum TaxID=3827 RepID=A0A1S3E4F0_CICAR|nr:trihelix transcription factor ASIL1 isoform X2 [Cicer arietinum]
MNEKIETKDHNPQILNPKEESPRKHIIIGSGGERLKRDEWSEGAVSTLLEAYESKWILRNRAKLKGQDWEDVAKYVSSRSNSTKSPKTQTQCKNKIESMKKRYRSESATSESSAWPLYSRLDLLLRGTGQLCSTIPTQHVTTTPSQLQHEDELETKSSDHVANKNPQDTDSSTPALYSEKDERKCNKRRKKTENNNNRQKKEAMGIAESIRWLAEVVVRSEQTRMDTLKEIEKMRVEAEAKRGEMEIKRTEIIANTQLEIARIFANVNNKGVDSSLRIGRS